jgi:RND family efflux transporter MFP subunit
LFRLSSRSVVSLSLVAALAACGREAEQKTQPPTAVETIVVRPASVPNIFELPGRIAAVRSSEVRARSDGIVLRRLYEEGRDVKAGTPLFQIDPRDYREQVQSSKATLDQAKAAQVNAASVVARYEKLIAEKAVSAQEFDKAKADLGQANGQVLDAKAALARSQLLLDYTTVRAPIAGRVGKAEVTEGALVSGSQATLMTQVDQVSSVYATFAESSAAILDMADQFRRGQLKVKSLASIEVRLVLENGDTYGPVGRVDFTSPVSDPQTGTRTIRAVFPNPEHVLTPGQFVRGRIEAGTLAGGFVIPARAMQFKGEEASVSILGPDGTVATRPITLGALLGKGWIVRSGLTAGERVIVGGWQKVRPGGKALDPGVTRSPVAQPRAPAEGR